MFAAQPNHRLSSPIERLVFGKVEFTEGEEHAEFLFKLLSIVMVSGALLTVLFILSSASGVNRIDSRHEVSMYTFTVLASGLWLRLRGRKDLYWPIAWSYEALCMAEHLSTTLFVPFDELRAFWFAINVAGVFVLLGRLTGWLITVASVILVVTINPLSNAPYSINALTTFGLGILYLGLFFHFYAARSISYFERMRQANHTLARMASHDALTEVLNARAYYETCEHLISSQERSKTPFSVLFIDLDHFKAINDTHGHAAGDIVLKTIARELLANIRKGDILGRVGGEEFSIFLPDTGPESAQSVAEKLRRAVEALSIHHGRVTLHITASLGIASYEGSHQTIQAIQRNADAAMYAAKAAGRNRVSRFGVPADEQTHQPNAPAGSTA